ncbi:trypsin-like peptidase domain-containing protein [Kiritimatiellota bacterium B12222]|nr:trypsin-like peptidase domain-containing protein [Kiritimatiellota bacterium B12222]
MKKHLPPLLLLSALCLGIQAQPLLNPEPTAEALPAANLNPVNIPEEIMQKVDPSVVSIQHEYAGGTGFIISEDGYILSNGHVVLGSDPEQPTEPAKRITVILSDERKYSAKVIGFSMDPDVALLKIDPSTPLKPVEFADSLAVSVGQRCFAVGTPVGLKRTFTSGILSNITRTDLGTETVVFQTDAAINSGNSGGPLFDSQGRVLGINTYASRGQNNLGFTIPIDVALEMIDDFKLHGRFIRSLVPLYFTNEIYDELARALQVENGVLIGYVMEGSSADKMGMKSGDILIKIDGEPVYAKTKADLLTFEWNQTIQPPGKKIEFTVLRGKPGEYEEVTLESVTEEFDLFPAHGRHVGELPEHRYATLGLGVERLTDLHRIIHEVQPGANGVFVKTVMEGSVASRAEISPGDVIYSISGQEVSDIATFRKVLDLELAKREKAIPVSIHRNKLNLITAMAPDYLMHKREVILIAPAGDNPDLDLIRRELLAKGATVKLATPDAVDLPRQAPLPPLKADLAISDLENEENANILIFTGGEASKTFWKDPQVLNVVKMALDNKDQVLACIGESTLLPVLATEGKLEQKLTLPKDLSGQAVMRGASYTGKEVESEKKLVTTTGTDKDVLRAFLQEVANIR